MSESNKPFVITDRRKFTLDGEPRPEAEESRDREAPPEPIAPVQAETSVPEPTQEELQSEETSMPPLTQEQVEQSRLAYQQTADRLDTAVRAANPGADHLPPMDFNQLVQSIYMTAIMQMGGATQEGEQPRVDILGARQSVDMLGVLEEKTKGNLSADEQRLLESAVFELRMAFLEITQALARSAAGRGAGAPKPGIVR